MYVCVCVCPEAEMKAFLSAHQYWDKWTAGWMVVLARIRVKTVVQLVW